MKTLGVPFLSTILTSTCDIPPRHKGTGSEATSLGDPRVSPFLLQSDVEVVVFLHSEWEVASLVWVIWYCRLWLVHYPYTAWWFQTFLSFPIVFTNGRLVDLVHIFQFGVNHQPVSIANQLVYTL